MKNNNYAYGKCFTCAKKFTINPLEIFEDFKEDVIEDRQICPGIIPAALYCDEHLKGARRRRFFDKWCQWLFIAGRIKEEKLLRWAQTLKGAEVEGSSQNITINIHSSFDADIWEDRGEEIVRAINAGGERGVKRDTSSIKDDTKEEESDHVDGD